VRRALQCAAPPREGAPKTPDAQVLAEHSVPTFWSTVRLRRLAVTRALVIDPCATLVAWLRPWLDEAADPWARLVTEDLRALAVVSPELADLGDPAAQPTLWKAFLLEVSPVVWKNMAKRLIEFDPKMPSTQTRFVNMGVESERNEAQHAIVCPDCPPGHTRAFLTKHACDVHRMWAHKRLRVARFKIGKVNGCPVCSRKFDCRRLAIQHCTVTKCKAAMEGAPDVSLRILKMVDPNAALLLESAG
jgi:hypothetical protein